MDSVLDGSKKAEIRKDDRGFEVGDELYLREWSLHTEDYGPRSVKVRVTYIFRGPGLGLKSGFVVMSFEVIK
ncbi:hypothetical protein BVY04_03920 [bacterium M21]|nr:hypothetical protein BVY04_03920 [bacterium M21]